MQKRAIEVKSEPRKVNSTFGRYAVDCSFEFTYNNGERRIMDGQEMFWRIVDARKFCKQFEAVTA